jgi:methyl-accepting chemotaxis protein
MPHSLFLLEADARPEAYAAFWDRLRAGHAHNGEFCRRAKDGSLVWLRATYTPVLGADGKPVRVMKLALDITENRRMQEAQQTAFEELQASEEEIRQQAEELQATQEEMRRRELELQASLAAIDRTLATIEFGMDGTVLGANNLFAALTGHDPTKLAGKHHRKLMPKGEADKPEYAAFWEALRRGLPQAGTFVRVAANGKPLQMHATYTPVRGIDGSPYKVLKLIQCVEPLA